MLGDVTATRDDVRVADPVEQLRLAVVDVADDRGSRWRQEATSLPFSCSSSSPQVVRQALNKRFTLGWKEKGKSEEINLGPPATCGGSFLDGEIHRERLVGDEESDAVVGISAVLGSCRRWLCRIRDG